MASMLLEAFAVLINLICVTGSRLRDSGGPVSFRGSNCQQHCCPVKQLLCDSVPGLKGFKCSINFLNGSKHSPSKCMSGVEWRQGTIVYSTLLSCSCSSVELSYVQLNL